MHTVQILDSDFERIIGTFPFQVTSSETAPSLYIVSPKLGETVVKGGAADYEIKWDSKGVAEVDVKIQRRDSTVILDEKKVMNKGEYNWSVPAETRDGEYIVRVCASNDCANVQSFSGIFNITAATTSSSANTIWGNIVDFAKSVVSGIAGIFTDTATTTETSIATTTVATTSPRRVLTQSAPQANSPADSEAVQHYGTVADCKENVVPKGTIHYITGVDEGSLQLKNDSVFVENTLRKERKITAVPLPVTPVYDLVAEGTPIFGTCYTDKESTAFQTDPPATIPYKAFIVLASGEKIVGPGTLTRRPVNPATDADPQYWIDGKWIYEWKIKGWRQGIASADNMKLLVAAIEENRPISILVEVSKKEGGVDGVRQRVSLSNCAPIYGSGGHKIVGAYSTDSIKIDQRVGHFDLVRANGFAAIEPLASYQSYFSYFVDLKENNESEGFDDESLNRQAERERRNQQEFPQEKNI